MRSGVMSDLAHRVANRFIRVAAWGKPSPITEKDLSTPLDKDALVVINFEGDPTSLPLRAGEKPLPVIQRWLERDLKSDVTLQSRRSSRPTEVAFDVEWTKKGEKINSAVEIELVKKR